MLGHTRIGSLDDRFESPSLKAPERPADDLNMDLFRSKKPETGGWERTTTEKGLPFPIRMEKRRFTLTPTKEAEHIIALAVTPEASGPLAETTIASAITVMLVTYSFGRRGRGRLSQ